MIQKKINLPPIIYLLILALVGGGGYWLFLKKSAPFSVVLAQATPTQKPTPQVIVQPQPVRVLPGQLDTVPMFNSNSPEWVKTEEFYFLPFPQQEKLFRQLT
jgi:hypothetical protein